MLHYEGYIDSDVVLPQLRNLKTLILLCSMPIITSFNWITPLTSLRSLTIATDTAKCDLSGLGELPALEDPEIHDIQWRCEAYSTLTFLTRLVKLRKLVLKAQYIHDFASFRSLMQLQTLEISSACDQIEAINIDALRGLVELREAIIVDTDILDLTPLVGLGHLRSVAISKFADCTPLLEADHPALVSVLHPKQNCLATSGHQTN